MTIDGRAFPLEPGEIVVKPSWSERSIEADEDLVLFVFSDRATQEKLRLRRDAIS